MNQYGIYFPPYNLCHSSASLGDWPPPLRNLHRNVAPEMANLPMLVCRSPLARLMMHFTLCSERRRSPWSWFPSKLCFTRSIMSNSCACFPTPIFHGLHVSPQLLHSLFSVACPFKISISKWLQLQMRTHDHLHWLWSALIGSIWFRSSSLIFHHMIIAFMICYLLGHSSM